MKFGRSSYRLAARVMRVKEYFEELIWGIFFADQFIYGFLENSFLHQNFKKFSFKVHPVVSDLINFIEFLLENS